MKVKILLTGSLLSVTVFAWGQAKTDTLKINNLKKDLKNYVSETDLTFNNSLVTDRAFNLFLQKKTSYYLSGVSEINLSRYYATYSSDNDKFNFGVNFKNDEKDKKLKWLLTPLLESNIKKNFTTLYKKGEWQSDIRFGAKFTLFKWGKITYKGMDLKSNQETNLIIVRNLELAKILKKIESDEVVRTEKINTSSQQIYSNIEELKKIANSKPDEVYKKTKKYLDSLTRNGNTELDLLINTEADKLSTLEDYKTQISTAEVERLFKRDSYTCFQNYWFSVWGFVPLTERKTYIAVNNTVNFEKERLKLWELNLQGNGIWESNNKFSLYASLGWKIFQNNSAIADLMTSVDYYQYSQFPETTKSNLAVLDNNKAYIGEYKEFVTNNFNLQCVLSLSNTDKNGKEKLVTPGISAYIEKNVGDFSATNLRFGVPLRFRGKSTPINIEPQIILKDITNYSNKEEKEKPTIGINVGIPFTALFK